MKNLTQQELNSIQGGNISTTKSGFGGFGGGSFGGGGASGSY